MGTSTETNQSPISMLPAHCPPEMSGLMSPAAAAKYRGFAIVEVSVWCMVRSCCRGSCRGLTRCFGTATIHISLSLGLSQYLLIVMNECGRTYSIIVERSYTSKLLAFDLWSSIDTGGQAEQHNGDDQMHISCVKVGRL